MAKKIKEPAASKRKLYSGQVKCQSTSNIGGEPIEGVVVIAEEAARTEDGVFDMFKSHYANANRADFTCEVVKDS